MRKTKLDHMKEMLSLLVYHKKLPFDRVVMLTWYATKAVMLHIELAKDLFLRSKRIASLPIRSGANPYQRVDALTWIHAREGHGETH